MKYFTILIPFVAGLLLLLISRSFGTVASVNALGQIVLFALIVCLPLYRTNRMSYVDLGWPLGIVLLGATTLFLSNGQELRVLAISIVYMLIGGRMALMAINHLRRGELDEELPRYAYQRRRWKKSGKTNEMLAAQAEVIAQGAFNASFLAYPILIIASNPSAQISLFEYVGLLVWLLSFIFEETADRQKRRFVARQKRDGIRDAVCDVGLWRYSRHPNYFGQWMGWNGILIAAIPSWWALYQIESILVWIGLAVGAGLVSYFMYNTLVYYSGAVPSEYYSVQKRPAFADYQRRTSRFFPRRPAPAE
ncbi:MAG: DUF1295 domain-containing protein [Pseudomonadota bacterium]